MMGRSGVDVSGDTTSERGEASPVDRNGRRVELESLGRQLEHFGPLGSSSTRCLTAAGVFLGEKRCELANPTRSPRHRSARDRAWPVPDHRLRVNIVRPDGWEGSAFEAKALSLREALTSLDSGGRADPQTVADAIAFAATDPEAPFRVVVGADANLILGAKGSMSIEEFEQTMHSTTGWYD